MPLRWLRRVREQEEFLLKRRMIVKRQRTNLSAMVYGVAHTKACATSAMRDAVNLIPYWPVVRQETGIEIEVLLGDAKAVTYIKSHCRKPEQGSFVPVQWVGGGSTELTFFRNTKLVFKRSFNIGTIRLKKKPGRWMDLGWYARFSGANEEPYNDMIAIDLAAISIKFSLSKRKEEILFQLNTKDYSRVQFFPLRTGYAFTNSRRPGWRDRASA